MKTALKDLREYYIEITPKVGRPYKKEVNGYRVILPEIPEIELFLYRKQDSKTWKVYDAKFGLHVATGYINDDRKHVIEHTREIIKKFGIPKFKRLYKEHYSEVK